MRPKQKKRLIIIYIIICQNERIDGPYGHLDIRTQILVTPYI